MQRIKGASLDQGFNRAFVQTASVNADTEIEQAGERTTLFARFHYGIDRLLACALDGTQTIANDFIGHRLKAVCTAIDIGWIEAHAKLQSIFKQDLEFVGIVHFNGHVGAEKLRREMDLQPTSVIRQQGISCGV